MRSLEHMHGNAVFDAYPCPTVLLDTEFTIRAANKVGDPLRHPRSSRRRVLERYWSPVTTPIFDDGRVVGVLHRAEDVTPLHEDLRRVLEQYRDIINAGPVTDSHARGSRRRLGRSPLPPRTTWGWWRR